MNYLRTITAATTTPVSLQEAKDHLYLTANDRDDDIARKLREAVDWCERRITGGFQFMTAVYEIGLDEFPDGQNDDDCRLELPVPPLQKVNFVKYRAPATGTLTTFGTTNGSTGSTGYYYTVKPTNAPGFIAPAYGQSWPATRAQPEAVTVRFTAGYSAQSSVPASIKAAVKLKLEELFDPERGEPERVERAIKSLLLANEYGAY